MSQTEPEGLPLTSLEPLVNLGKRRGFVYPSSEIYGGVASLFDYGPLGIELKNNLKQLWWQTFVHGRDDVVGLDSSIIMHPRVWEASGHLESFADPMAECLNCHTRVRADRLPARADKAFWQCAEGGEHQFGPTRQFNLLFQTSLGATDDSASRAYLRPETAQGMFVDFKTIVETSRAKVPFGIAQIGRAFRNELGLGNWLFRLREFEIAEIEFFVAPGDDDRWFDLWVAAWKQFYAVCGIASAHVREDVKAESELAHYSKATTDFAYRYPFGWDELGAVANRTDYDLKRHAEFSGKDLGYFDAESKEKYIPFVIEPTQGIDRLFIAVLCEAYKEYPGGRTVQSPSPDPKSPNKPETEIVLHLPPALAPFKAAVLPLVKKDGLAPKAQEITSMLRGANMPIFYDESGSIGRRYRRQDEIGTPWCVTIDAETLENDTVTIRDRDTMTQIRHPVKSLVSTLYSKIHAAQ